MTDLPPSQDSSGGAPPRTPRWVKVLGITAVVVVLLFIILLVAGGGQHGPGRHL